MKKINKILLSVAAIATLASNLSADVGSSVSKQKQKNDTKRDSKSTSKTQSDTKSLQKSDGSEKSINKSITKSLSNIKSWTNSSSKTKTGTWQITINPMPYILDILQKNGWNEKAFFVTNSDIGTSYFLDDEELIDNLKKSAIEATAANRGKLGKDEMENVSAIINILKYTADVSANTIEELNHYYNIDIHSIDAYMNKSVLAGFNKTIFKKVEIKKCNFGGNQDTFTCNNGEYTLKLTDGIPILLNYGNNYYSQSSVKHITPIFTISFANSTSDAFSKLLQDSESRAVAEAVRDYTSKLRSQNQSETASKVEAAFVEKALTTNISLVANAATNAINSGNPLAVLKVFQ